MKKLWIVFLWLLTLNLFGAVTTNVTYYKSDTLRFINTNLLSSNGVAFKDGKNVFTDTNAFASNVFMKAVGINTNTVGAYQLLVNGRAVISDNLWADSISLGGVPVADSNYVDVVASSNVTVAAGSGVTVATNTSGKQKIYTVSSSAAGSDVYAALDSNDFAFVVLPDLQGQTRATSSMVLSNMVGWVVSNSASANIKMVLSTGDMLDWYSSDDNGQFAYFSNAMGRITREFRIPYQFTTGNHDLDPDGSHLRNTTNFNVMLGGTNWMMTNSWWSGGFYDDSGEGRASSIVNSYVLQTNGMYKYVWMVLEGWPRYSVLTWANSILNTYSNHLAFIATHSYLYGDGSRSLTKDRYMSGYGDATASNGEQMWSYLRQNQNLVAIFCGHQIIGDPALGDNSIQRGRSIGVGNYGNPVTQIIANWQVVAPGQSWVRIYKVRPKLNRVEVYSYDTVAGTWSTDLRDQFEFPLLATAVTPIAAGKSITIENTYTNSVGPFLAFQEYSNGLFNAQWSIGTSGTMTRSNALEFRYGNDNSHHSNTLFMSLTTNGMLILNGTNITGGGSITGNYLPTTNGTAYNMTNVGTLTVRGQILGKYLSDVDIACFGDSLTVGYVPYLAALLPSNTCWNYGLGGQGAAAIATRALANSNVVDFKTIIWAGNNDATDLTPILSNIANIVSTRTSSNYLVLGLTVNTNYMLTETHTNIVATNAVLASIYPGHFLDIRSILVSSYDPGIPQDVIDFGNDAVPSSLRSDAIHLNVAGYTIVATQIVNYIQTNGWLTRSKVFGPTQFQDAGISLGIGAGRNYDSNATPQIFSTKPITIGHDSAKEFSSFLSIESEDSGGTTLRSFYNNGPASGWAMIARPLTLGSGTNCELLLSNKSVGIHRLAPTYTLDIVDPDSRGGLQIFEPDGTPAIYMTRAGSYSGQFDFASGYFQMRSIQDIPIIFSTGYDKERIRIAADGNVGIGTNAPSEKLEVAGNVKVGGNLTVLGEASTSNFYTGDLLVSNAIPQSVGGTGLTNVGVGKLLAGQGTNLVEVTIGEGLGLNTNTWTLTNSGTSTGVMTNANVASFVVTNRFQNLTHDLVYDGTNVTVDLSTGNRFRLNVTNNFLLTFANVADGQDGHIIFVQDQQNIGGTNVFHDTFRINTINTLTNAPIALGTNTACVDKLNFSTYGTNVFLWMQTNWYPQKWSVADTATNTGGGAFVPSDLTSLMAWWKADSLSLSDGDAVNTWEDSEGTSDCLIESGTNKPIYVASAVNSKPALRFSEGAIYFTNSCNASNKPFTVALVFNCTNVASTVAFIGANSGALRVGLNSGQIRVDKHNSAILNTQTGTITNAQWYVVMATYDTDGSGVIYVNGGSDGTGSNNQTFDPSPMTYIGSTGPSDFFQGYMAEVMKFDAVLSTADRNSVGDYLATKYGLTWAH